jgi:outer membrane protein OmpA-like peptidoglycan-associated protein
VVAYTDATGTDEVNRRIGLARADAVRGLLERAGVARVSGRWAGPGDRRAVVRCTPTPESSTW